MAGSLHGSARTTPRVRAELQASQDITSSLAQRYSLSRTTGQQGANPNHDHECVAGAELSLQHRAHAGGGGDGGRVPPPHAAAARRRPAFLLERRARLPTRQHPKAYPLKPAPMPGTVRHLPPARKPGQRLQAGQIAATAIGHVHVDISELRLAQGKLNMFLAIDRVCKFTYVEFRNDAGKMNGASSCAMLLIIMSIPPLEAA